MSILDNDFLMNLIQNTPEVQAGYMPVDTSGIRGLYQPPTGPLYNVNFNDQYFNDDMSNNPKYTFQYDEGALNKMEDAYIDTGVVPEMNNLKGAEFRLRDDLKPSMFTNMRPAINTFKREGDNENKLGYTFNNKLNTELGLTAPINISEHYERLVGTKPTSPRNSEMIYTGIGVDEIPNLNVNNASDDLMRAFGYEYPETINRDAVNTVRHEIAHNVNELPNYVDSTNFARNINMNELFGIPNAIGSNPLGYYDKDNMTEHAKEELFNRAKDTYFEKNDEYYPPNHRFRTLLGSQKYINDNLKTYSNSSNRFHGLNTYSNYIQPKVKQHFDQMKIDALNFAKTNNQRGGNGGGNFDTSAADRAGTSAGSGQFSPKTSRGRSGYGTGGLI
tara:strand:- start:403 stop:1569 length:1167 start_codon:yes stop_codon:yes gene_type:complete